MLLAFVVADRLDQEDHTGGNDILVIDKGLPVLAGSGGDGCCLWPFKYFGFCHPATPTDATTRACPMNCSEVMK